MIVAKRCVETRMSTESGTPDGAADAGGKKRIGRGRRIFRTVLIGILVSIALLIAFPPLGLIKDTIARNVGDNIGRTVTIGGMSVSLDPFITAEFTDVRVANPPGMPERDLFHGETVRATVAFFPLFKGRVRLESLALVNPTLALEEGADGTRNWLLGAAQGAQAAPAEPVAANVSPPPVTTVDNGRLAYTSALSGADYGAERINGTVLLDLVTGAGSSKGSLVARGETVAFDIALGDYDAPLNGGVSPLKATLDGRLVRANIDGDANFQADAEFKGSLAASTPSLVDFVGWASGGGASGGEPLKTSLEGQIVGSTRDIAFADTDVMVNTTTSRFNGTLDFSGDRPKVSGDISSEHIDLDRIIGLRQRSAIAPSAAPTTDFEPVVAAGWEQLLADLRALEAGPQAAAQARAEAERTLAASAAGAPSWSQQPFNLKGIRAVDLDVTMSAADITYGKLDLSQGKIGAKIDDGVLDATIEQLAVGSGSAVGTLSLDARAEPPKAAVKLSLTNVAAEPIATQFTGNPLLSGTSNVEITATAAGQNQSQLTETLDGKAHFQMGQGALRGFNVRRMIFEWWKSWSFDLAQRTSFTRLDAQYDIRKGIMQSRPGFSMGGPEVEINSTGSVNVPARSLNQEIRVKAIPPPTAFPIPIRISGSWTKPSIAVDWWGLFSASPGLGGPQALAPAPEPPPAEVEAAIRRVLAADLPPDQLSPQAKEMLRSLLPAEDDPVEGPP